MADIEAPKQYDDIDGIISPAAHNRLFGHNTILHFLGQMRMEGHLHHALLFEGPQGIGKATLAYQLAWNVLTDQKEGFVQPDKNSQIWRQIAQASYPGLLHVSRRYDTKTDKFKTGISVEDIRDISHLLSQTSTDGGWRVVIIDPADDMNRNAANAILKTLEEPPSKTLFILISHFAGRLLPTIRSRCHTVTFRPLERVALEQALDFVLEHQNLDHSVKERAIEIADGSVRKAAMLITYGGLEIIKTVDEILSRPTFDAIQAQQLGQVLNARDAIPQFQQFCEYILTHIFECAKTFAEKQNTNEAQKWAVMWENFQLQIGETEAFNLDKKQFVLNLLYELHHTIHRKK